MKTAKIKLDGKEFLVCCTLGTLKNLDERFGGLENMQDALEKNISNAIDEIVWVVNQIMQAGSDYARIKKIENPEVPTEEELLILCGLDDIEILKNSIYQTIAQSMEQEIKLETKGDTTPGK